MTNNPTYELSPNQQLYLWSVLLARGNAWHRDLKPNLKKADRDQLAKAGLIEETKGKNRRVHVQLTDQGWSWLEKNVTTSPYKPNQKGIPVPGAILMKLLATLHELQQRQNLTFADIFALHVESVTRQPEPVVQPPTTVEPETVMPPPPPTLDERIRQSYIDIAQGEWNSRVRLADLRQKLADVSRADLDQALLKLMKNQKLKLYSLDNPRFMTEADHEAAVDVIGQKFHILYMES